MNCQEAQELFDDLTRERLDDATASMVRGHLDDCTDCRVQLQRTQRLQRLLALKKYEQPPAAYWDGFLGEFHRRLEAEPSAQNAWQRWQSRWAQSWQTAAAGLAYWRPVMASATVVVLCGSAAWLSWQATRSQPEWNAQSAQTDPTALAVMVDAAPAPLPRFESQLTSGPVDVVLAEDEAGSPHTRYVLDRLVSTPVSYEMANVDF